MLKKHTLCIGVCVLEGSWERLWQMPVLAIMNCKNSTSESKNTDGLFLRAQYVRSLVANALYMPCIL